jgi:hypothetical protein
MVNYRDVPGLNWSRLKLIGRSPLHFQLGIGEIDESAASIGTAVHCGVLEPERFEQDFIYYPGSVRRGKAWEEFEALALGAGKTVLSKSEHAQVIAMRDAVMRQPRAKQLFTGGAAEVLTTWKLASFDCKGRFDYIRPDALIDLKTTDSAHPKAFAYSCVKYGYHGQAAWYADGHFRATGQRLPFYFVAVDKRPPHVVTVFRVPDHVLEAGRNLYLSYLETLDRCQQSGEWPGYTIEPEIDLELPPNAAEVQQ